MRDSTSELGILLERHASPLVYKDSANFQGAHRRPDGTPGIGLFGSNGKIRASLDVGGDDTSGFNVYDEAGTLRAAMALRPDGTPAMGLFDQQGGVIRSIEPSQQPR